MKLSSLVAPFVLLFSTAWPALGQAPAAPPVRLGEFDDRPVVDANGTKIADVYDVVVETEEARVAYIVFSVGLKVVPVAIPSPDMMFTKDKVELAFNRARLEGMPALDMSALGPRYKRGRDLIGTQLKDPVGAILGEVKDLMIDLGNGNVAAVVVAFDPKVRQDKGWSAIPRESVRYQSGGYVAHFNLAEMRPAAQAEAERKRYETAQAAAITVDRDERVSELIGRKIMDSGAKPVGEVADFLVDPASGRVTHILVNAGGIPSALTLPLPGLVRQGEWLALPAGAPLAPAAPSPTAKRASELMKRTLVDGRGKEVGRLRDVIVNLGKGQVRYAVAEFDPSWIAAGYLVPIKVPGEDRKVELNALTGSMIFEQARWPDINTPQFIANMDAYLAKQK
jgi:sporulation protein YlmC with PRC-barrel domain